MSPQERFASVLNRLATTPSIIRTRREDEQRAELMAADFDVRVEAAVVRLEKVASELEKALA